MSKTPSVYSPFGNKKYRVENLLLKHFFVIFKDYKMTIKYNHDDFFQMLIQFTNHIFAHRSPAKICRWNIGKFSASGIRQNNKFPAVAIQLSGVRSTTRWGMWTISLPCGACARHLTADKTTSAHQLGSREGEKSEGGPLSRAAECAVITTTKER